MATVKYDPKINLNTLKEGDTIDFGEAGQFSKNAQGGFAPLTAAQPNASATPPAAAQPPAAQPNATQPPTPAAPISLLPSNQNPGVVTSGGAQSGSSPSIPPANGAVPPQPGIGIAGAAFTQPTPQPPSMEAILSQSHIPTLQSYLTSIQQSQMQLQNAYKAYILGINGEGTPQGIVDALSNEQAKNFQIQMDTLNQQEALASSQLSNAMTFTQMYMTAAGTDYTNAVNHYQTQFDNAYKIQSLYNQTATQEQNNASAYLNTVATMIGQTGIDWSTASPSMKATIQAMEAQAGWPAGTLETFAKVKPGANILGTQNGVDPTTGHQTTSIIYAGPDGKPGVITTVVLPTSPVSLFSNYNNNPTQSPTNNGYDGSILQGTSLDPQATVKDIVNNPQQFQALVAAMTGAEGGTNAAGAQANNPLDLKFTPAMKAWGATDSGIKAQDGGTFAAFPDQATALKAYQTQFSQPEYSNLSLDQALQKWSGKSTSTSQTSSVDPTVKSYADQVMNGTITSISGVPNTGPDRGLRDAVSRYIDTLGPDQFTPLAIRRYTMDSNAIVANYINQPSYTMVSNALPYLTRIDAATQNPGSVSDQELLDSLTKIDTGGGVITDAQVKLITDGQSWSDALNVLKNKAANGGVLSTKQRAEMVQLAHSVYQGYQKVYQPLYNEATTKLQGAGIPKSMWTIPDLNSLSAQSGYPMGGASSSTNNSGSTTIGGNTYSVGGTVTIGGVTYTITQ